MHTSLTVNIIKKIHLILIGFTVWSCSDKVGTIVTTSPNEKLQILILEEDEYLTYQAFYDGEKILSKSKLGLQFSNKETFPSVGYSKTIERRFYENTWELPWGETRKVKNKFNETKITFRDHKNQKVGNILFRAYDDGIAFRYQLLDENAVRDTIIIKDEISQFNLTEDAESWWIPAYTENRYEHLYNRTKISKIDTVHTPLTIRYSNNIHLSIHEADLVNYSSMQLFSEGNTLNCDLAPWSNGDKVRRRLPFETPWRTVLVAKEAKDLIASNLTINCNDSSLIDDPSWIQPSKYIGIWWGMIVGKWTWGEGSRHGATNERAMEYIDFASANGFEEVLIEGWSSGWKGLFPKDSVTISFTESTPDIDLFALQKYAKSKNTSLQLYHETSGNTKNYLAQIDSAFSLLNDLGIKNVKIGQVGAKLDKKEYHYSQYGVNYYRKVLQKALDHKIGVNFHEPIKDTGERRTFPNMLTREGARGMEYNAWSGGNPPNHTLIIPYTRLLGSPMDFTPGIFDLLLENIDKHNNKEYPITITVIDSGNGYENFRFKSSESIWMEKQMDLKTILDNGKKINVWTIQQYVQVGEWEWGVVADLPNYDKNNIWIIETLSDKKNRVLSMSNIGVFAGENNIKIPYQDLEKSSADFIKGYQNLPVQRISTTLAKQLALYVVINSPLQMASDFIENYYNHPAFDFIKEVPVSWDTTIVLKGEIEEYLLIARKDRKSKDWYLGAITDSSKRNFQLELSFLEKENYYATIYADSEEADWDKNPGLFDISKKTFTNGDTIQIILAEGGGQAIHFKYNE